MRKENISSSVIKSRANEMSKYNAIIKAIKFLPGLADELKSLPCSIEIGEYDDASNFCEVYNAKDKTSINIVRRLIYAEKFNKDELVGLLEDYLEKINVRDLVNNLLKVKTKLSPAVFICIISDYITFINTGKWECQEIEADVTESMTDIIETRLSLGVRDMDIGMQGREYEYVKSKAYDSLSKLSKEELIEEVMKMYAVTGEFKRRNEAEDESKL